MGRGRCVFGLADGLFFLFPLHKAVGDGRVFPFFKNNFEAAFGQRWRANAFTTGDVVKHGRNGGRALGMKAVADVGHQRNEGATVPLRIGPAATDPSHIGEFYKVGNGAAPVHVGRGWTA